MRLDPSVAVTADGWPPVRLIEVELAAPGGTAWPGAPDAGTVERIVALVRLHSIPLGLVTVHGREAANDTSAIARAIESELGPTVRGHLTADGITEATAASPEGPPWPSDVPCLAPRRALLAAPPPVTVVVPVADRPDLLRACLADLALQSYPERTVVVVDNAPGYSGAGAVVRAHNAERRDEPGGRDAVRYVVEPRPGSSRARNRGLAVATTAITAFVDADVRLDRDWLAELVRPLVEDPLTGCATGLILPAALDRPGERLIFEWGGYEQGFEPRRYERSVPAEGVPLHPFQPGVFGSGQSMAFRTNVLRAVGGFDLALGVCTPSQGGEDQAAMLDVVLLGWRLAYTPSAIVWHPDPPGIEAVLRKLNSYGVGLTALLTRTIVRRPGSLRMMLARMPGAVAYFFRRGSQRNRRHSAAYPRRAVWMAELRGMAWGPVAYVLSVLAAAPSRRARGTRTSVARAALDR